MYVDLDCNSGGAEGTRALAEAMPRALRLADHESGPSERGEHRPIEWGRRVCRGIVFYPGGSAVWRQCWLCAVCAGGRAGCCVGGGGDTGGVSISSSRRLTPAQKVRGAGFAKWVY